jgi:hypothetical protein
MVEHILSLQEAAERTGQSVTRISRWCATGQLRCERDVDGWRIPSSELPKVAQVAQQHSTAVEEARVTALVVPAPVAPPDLADLVAYRLGLSRGAVAVTPLALDGVEYVVAVWPGSAAGDGGLPSLKELANQLGAELLDGEVRKDIRPGTNHVPEESRAPGS